MRLSPWIVLVLVLCAAVTPARPSSDQVVAPRVQLLQRHPVRNTPASNDHSPSPPAADLAGTLDGGGRGEAARLGAFLETAEQQSDHDKDQDQQHHPHQAAAGPGSWPPPPTWAPGPIPVIFAPSRSGPHAGMYAQARRDMQRDPNYLPGPG